MSPKTMPYLVRDDAQLLEPLCLIGCVGEAIQQPSIGQAVWLLHTLGQQLKEVPVQDMWKVPKVNHQSAAAYHNRGRTGEQVVDLFMFYTS